jgi:hypothetical protein
MAKTWLGKAINDQPIRSGMRALKRLHRADLVEKSIADEYLAEEHIVDERMVDERMVDERMVDERMVDERMVDERMVDERMVEASRELSDGVGPLCSPTIKANQRRKTGPEPAPSPSASSSANYRHLRITAKTKPTITCCS